MRSLVILVLLSFVAQGLCAERVEIRIGWVNQLKCKPHSRWVSECGDPCHCRWNDDAKDWKLYCEREMFRENCMIEEKCIPRTYWKRNKCKRCFCLDVGLAVCEEECYYKNWWDRIFEYVNDY